MREAVLHHYVRNWGGDYRLDRWPGERLEIAVFPPRAGRNVWTYATVGMSETPEAGEAHGLELFLFSRNDDAGHVELLTVMAWFHQAKESLGLGHTVNFGRPWQPDSTLGYGLISLPYLDGPKLEWDPEQRFRCLWLIPITGAERNYKIESGQEALEQALEAANFDYADPMRASVV
jgi:hypothetical protein